MSALADEDKGGTPLQVRPRDVSDAVVLRGVADRAISHGGIKNKIRYSAIQTQHHPKQYHTMQLNTINYNTMQYITVESGAIKNLQPLELRGRGDVLPSL